MKVLHVIDKSFLGGGQSCVLNLLAGFGGSEIRTALSCRDGGPLVEAAESLGVRVHPVPFDKRFRPGPARRLARIAEEEGAHLVHTHGLVAATWASLARGFGLRAPVIYHQHGFHHHNYGPLTQGPRRFAEKRACRRAARVVAVSDADARALRGGGYGPPEQVVRIHYGIPEPTASDAEVAAARQTLGGTAACGPVVGLVSRLHPQKAVDVFLRAAARVLREEPGVRFVVVGDGELGGELRRMARDLDLDGRLHWAGGVPAQPWVRIMDVAALTSRWEGLPLTLLEYMASSRPVVASAVDGNVEAVGDAGELVPVGDDVATGDAILRLLRSEELAARRRAAARARYAEAFTVPHMVEQVQSLYAEVLA